MITLSFVAAALTTFSFIPQALQVIKTQNTSGISLGMYVMFVTGVFLWMVYGFWKGDMAVALANAITLVFASVILKYKVTDVIQGKHKR
jgi:MtN3 and saliva related transmembrane protein